MGLERLFLRAEERRIFLEDHPDEFIIRPRIDTLTEHRIEQWYRYYKGRGDVQPITDEELILETEKVIRQMLQKQKE